MLGHTEYSNLAVMFKLLLIASLPELHWPDVGCDEYDTPKEWTQGRGEDRGGERLEEKHGGV